METFEARLQSFESKKAPSKKRASSGQAEKGPQWPHINPAPALLAQAGFYYDPNEISEDRVTCCLCHTVLDGWEPEDNPINEHINYSPSCGIAIHAKIEQDVEAGIHTEEDPNSEDMINARKATFRDLWPHEKKRGWVCKTQKMAEAGWYYCPTSESDDFVKCAYCGLSLDGWEPKDKPLEEHQRRSASCILFSFQQPAKPKATKTKKKSRVSKASRLSTQSTGTNLEDTEMMDATIDEGETVLTTTTEAAQAPNAKSKKSTRSKKGRTKTKAATASAESALASSILEPEDDDFEVKVDAPAPKAARVRKRKSDEIVDEQEEEAEVPAPKRRGTRARASTVADTVANTEIIPAAEEAQAMVDETESPARPAGKKGKRTTAHSRASSTARKVSATSTASKAPLRSAEPDDMELEAALEADLDRPLSDNEDDLRSLKPTKPRVASKSQTKKIAASTAAVRQEQRESTISSTTMQTANEEISVAFNADETLPSVAPIQNPKQRGPKKGKAHQGTAPALEKSALNVADEEEAKKPVEVGQPVEEEVVTRGKGRQPSRKASRTVSRQKAKAADTQAVPEPESIATHDVSNDVTMLHVPVKDENKAAPAKQPRSRKVTAPTTKNTTNETPAVKVDVETVKNAMIVEVVVPVATEEPSSKAAPAKEAKPKATRGRPAKAKKASAAPVAEAETHTEPEFMPEQFPERVVAEATISPDRQHEHQAQETTASQPAPTSPSTPHKSQASTSTQQQQQQQQQIPSPTPSPQPSDAENQPPSSRPSATRPPLTASVAPASPAPTRIPLAASTPTAARANMNPGSTISRLTSTFAWSSVDLEEVLSSTLLDKENVPVPKSLASPEKRMTVEEWIRFQAVARQEGLRRECEGLVQRFEVEGVRALKALEGIVAAEE